VIQLSSLMWTLGIFFAIIGFLRGWVKELVATAGLVLALFTIFQFDGLLRGTVFVTLPRSQIFLLQMGFFFAVAFIVYQTQDIGGAERRDERDIQAGLIGTVIGFLNGYLIGGSLWYFLDINEYPLEQFVIAPAADSASAQSVNLIPLVLLGGGASGTGDLLAIGVIILLFLVLIVV